MDQSRNVLGRREPGSVSDRRAQQAFKTSVKAAISLGGLSQERALLGRRPGPDLATTLPEPIGETVPGEPAAGQELNEVHKWWSLGDNLKLLGRVAVGLVLILACCVLLFLAAQTAALSREFSYLPRPAYLVSVAALILIWAAVAIAAAQLSISIVRLRRSPAISLAVLRELDRRNKARSHYESAERSLRRFLDSYPRTTTQRKLLHRAGIVDDCNSSEDWPAIKDLVAAREHLLEPRYGTSEDWLAEVNRTFVHRLDDGATKLIRNAYLSVAAKTAIAPRGFLDGIIVLASSWCLMRDLCQLYGLRPGALDTSILLLHTFAQTLVAQQLGDAQTSIQDEIQHHVADVAGRLGAEIAGKAIGRVAEGTVNAILIRRLGRRLQRTIRPIVEK